MAAKKKKAPAAKKKPAPRAKARAIEAEELTDVVLCGHSYGGMVITGVADRLPGRVKALVYLDAFLPKHGDSLIGLLDTALPPDLAIFLPFSSTMNPCVRTPSNGARPVVAAHRKP